MAHVWWHATICFSWIPTRHTQILKPVQDPNTSYTKPFTVNPYAGAAFQQFKQFIRPVQAPYPSHARSLRFYRFATVQIIPYSGEASQKIQHFLMRVQAPNASHANPYACAGP
ncbi:hypothetical protein O181_091894 [Austropuccinia psidii MF-1]|uniref:Uncharacterized protein n=1 Tax=Austropuccinia psidii MF-1 TaxID=1389203 RepID=A0A9Q3IY82_9BASI|nr:hypothetical protein [Austropuccinia psidii MF-1]